MTAALFDRASTFMLFMHFGVPLSFQPPLKLLLSFTRRFSCLSSSSSLSFRLYEWEFFISPSGFPVSLQQSVLLLLLLLLGFSYSALGGFHFTWQDFSVFIWHSCSKPAKKLCLNLRSLKTHLCILIILYLLYMIYINTVFIILNRSHHTGTLCPSCCVYRCFRSRFLLSKKTTKTFLSSYSSVILISSAVVKSKFYLFIYYFILLLTFWNI